MGKTRDLFKKIGDTKGTFHAKMGSIFTCERPQRESQMVERIMKSQTTVVTLNLDVHFLLGYLCPQSFLSIIE